MNLPLHRRNKIRSHTAKLIVSTVLVFNASVSIADEANVAYVDSVHKWGAWGLDIEPAAGGLSEPNMQPLNARDSKVRLRTNSIAALAPPRASVPVPPAPVLPIAPPPIITLPTITPINPSVPIPIGGPGLSGGSSITAPTISTISPNVPIPAGAPSGGPGA